MKAFGVLLSQVSMGFCEPALGPTLRLCLPFAYAYLVVSKYWQGKMPLYVCPFFGMMPSGSFPSTSPYHQSLMYSKNASLTGE